MVIKYILISIAMITLVNTISFTGNCSLSSTNYNNQQYNNQNSSNNTYTSNQRLGYNGGYTNQQYNQRNYNQMPNNFQQRTISNSQMNINPQYNILPINNNVKPKYKRGQGNIPPMRRNMEQQNIQYNNVSNRVNNNEWQSNGNRIPQMQEYSGGYTSSYMGSSPNTQYLNSYNYKTDTNKQEYIPQQYNTQNQYQQTY